MLFIILLIGVRSFAIAQDSTFLNTANSSFYAVLQAGQLQADLKLTGSQTDSVKAIYSDYYKKVAAADNLTLSEVVRKDYLSFHEHALNTRLMNILTPVQWELKKAREVRLKFLADSLQHAAGMKSFKKLL